MLVGILCGSWQMALLAVAGNLVGNLTACLCKYSREDIRNGLYGFNGTLVGIAIGVFMPINLLSIALLIAGSALSTWIARLFGYWGKLAGIYRPVHFIGLDIAGRMYIRVSLAFVGLRSCRCRTITRSGTGLLSEYRTGDVPRKYDPVRSVLPCCHPCQFTLACIIYGLGSPPSHPCRLGGRNRLYGAECRTDRLQRRLMCDRFRRRTHGKAACGRQLPFAFHRFASYWGGLWFVTLIGSFRRGVWIHIKRM